MTIKEKSYKCISNDFKIFAECKPYFRAGIIYRGCESNITSHLVLIGDDRTLWHVDKDNFETLTES